MAQAKAGSDGRFEVNSQETPGADVILYLVSKGGAAASGSENAATAMLLVLNNAPPPKVVINELTTVASAFTAARFICGESISGNPLGLRIAAGNVPNLVDPATGSWGKVVLDQTNLTHTTTLANLNTLGSPASLPVPEAEPAQLKVVELQALAPTVSAPKVIDPILASDNPVLREASFTRVDRGPARTLSIAAPRI